MTRKRPEVLIGETYKFRTEIGKCYITINSLEGIPIEVRIQVGKSGNILRNILEVLGVTLSKLLQSLPEDGMIDFLEDNFEKVKGDDNVLCEGIQYSSIFDFIAKKLLSKLQSGVKVTAEFKTDDPLGKP